ncbi:hypothetical protein QBC42DRAFT_272141 [Cladorrhinum samala]|uniref:Uncharacterized protein n=1 Tax=Cladorrhinum samala TaxID=585594 RepID=A0AAV9HIK2_9PEZI|nr:hypothetical protein QBC42DRAFT_272141 [Cladorrhinum samala]
MLDENLPTFRLKPSSESPLSSILFFTQNGSEPSAEYLLRKPDPALPASRNKYALALCDPYNQDVIFGEVMVEPEWSQPTLSGAEIRAQSQGNAPGVPVTAMVPDNFTIQLYNPDQSIPVKLIPGSWNKTDSWEFEMPVQTFRTPTISEIDRELQNSSPAAADLVPRIMFRWKKEGKLSKDMTCYMTGKNVSGRKSKEPDITIAMFKHGKESATTIYQPNLTRVEVEDRKGLELILLLGAEVIKDLYLAPKSGIFNVSGGTPTPTGNVRKNSRPSTANGAPLAAAAMSGALSNAPPSSAARTSPPPPATIAASNVAPPGPKPGVTFTTTPTADIEAETRRLQEMLEREKREREKAERAEQKRIKKMLEEEEKERLRKEAEIAKETERLRKEYGVDGQDLPSDRPSLPPRPQVQAPVPQFAPPPVQTQPQHSNIHGLSPWFANPGPAPPPRPVSAGPTSVANQQQQQQGPFHCDRVNTLWKAGAGQLHQIRTQVENRLSAVQLAHQQQQAQQPGSSGRRGSEDERKRIKKKRSSHW